MRPTQASKHLCLLGVIFFLPQIITAAGPTTEEILDSLRLAAFSSDAKLTGRIRHDGENTAFAIDIEPGKTIYSFPGTEVKFALSLTSDGASLSRLSGGSSTPVSSNEKPLSIAKSDLALGDLAFEFLYWENAERRDDEKILGLPAYQIRLKAPSRSALYAAVDVYASKQTGALLQILCYNWDGKLVKRFKVIKGQRVDGYWTLQQMRIESFAPGSRRPASRSYIEIDEVVSEITQ